MDYIEYNGEQVPYKFTNAAKKKFEDMFKVRLAELGEKIEIKHMIGMSYLAIEAGCRIDDKVNPFKTMQDFETADEKHDYVDSMWLGVAEEQKK